MRSGIRVASKRVLIYIDLMPDHMRSYLDFEKPVAELEAKVDELRALAATGSDIGDEISRIEDKAAQALSELYANLTPWQKTLVARHPQRPHFTDFINALISEFTPLAGDRKFGEDHAPMGGVGRFHGESSCVIGTEKDPPTQPRTQPKPKEAATSIKTRAQARLRLGGIDSILREPSGGAHRDPAAMITTTGDAIAQAFDDLRNLDRDMIRRQRRQKFLDIGRKMG